MSRFHGLIQWPPSMFLVATVLVIGIILLIGAIAVRRKAGSPFFANALLLAAALWNGAIVFAFLSPHNRHVFHLATHQSSVVVNAMVGVAWLSLCAMPF